MPTLTLIDETATGQTLREHVVELLTERATVRELIEHRVCAELASRERAAPSSDPSPSPQPRSIVAEQACAEALKAFARNQIIVLVGERQVYGLDESVVVAPETRVRFLRLTPLAGG